MTQVPLVYILIPVHNRQATTLACLATLNQNGDLSRYRVIVIDDGSTDGTAEAIQRTYPTVVVLRGDGQLWWTGAITMGMEYAYHREADYFIWLNDDTLPQAEAITKMVSACGTAPCQIISAQCYADDSFSQPTYGGRRRKYLSLEFLAAAPDQYLPCDLCSGNLVCLPRSVVDTIGYPPDDRAPHLWGDVIYTWTARQAGFQIKVLGAAMAISPPNPMETGWATSSLPMARHWQLLRSPKSSIYPPAYWFYCRQLYGHAGPWVFVTVYLKLVGFTILRWVMPLPWLNQLKQTLDRIAGGARKL